MRPKIRRKAPDEKRELFVLQHLKQLDLLAGRTGKEPVLQAAEGVRQDFLFRCGEADDTGSLEVCGGLVEVVNVYRKVGDTDCGNDFSYTL